MLINAVWNCLSGYVMIRVEGLSLERFLNIAVENKVRIWEARRDKYTQITAFVNAAGYRKLNKLNDSRYGIQILKRGGLTYLLADAKKRLALTIGIILIATVILALSLFIWQIKLTGLEKMDAYTLMQEINSLGICEGAYKGNVDLKALENHMIRKYPQIAWINAQYEGVVLSIQVVEAKMPPDIIDNEGTADIIAKKDAFVKKLIVLDGKAAVKEGQTVRKGQMLIEGELWEEGKPRLSFHARGSVIGNVWYMGQAGCKLYNTINTPTGRAADLRYIQIGNNLVLLGGENPGFQKFENKIKMTYALGENLFFPVKVLDVRQFEVNEQRIMRSISEARAEAEEKAYNKALQAMPDDAKITDLNFKFEIHEDMIMATCYIKTEEELGITIKTNENNPGGQ